MKSRVEVNEQGELFIVLPDELVQEFMIEEGDTVFWELQDDFAILTFE